MWFSVRMTTRLANPVTCNHRERYSYFNAVESLMSSLLNRVRRTVRLDPTRRWFNSVRRSDFFLTGTSSVLLT